MSRARFPSTSFAVILSIAAIAAGCDRSPVSPTASPAAPTAAAANDPYDVSKMELKSPAAVVSADRHTGAFAAGSALSMEALLKPLDPAPVKEVRLDTTHKIIEIAPGVKFCAWTFGDQVPGPVVRARVGDRIKFTMTNRSDEPVPGGQFVAAPMMHSMDFHSAMVSPQDKYRSIAPGQTISFEFVAELPRRFHVPLRHADGARAHRLGHVRNDDRRAARWLSDQSRSRICDRAERVLYEARPAATQGRRRAAVRARRRAGAQQGARPIPSSTAATTAWSISRCRPSRASACACS